MYKPIAHLANQASGKKKQMNRWA